MVFPITSPGDFLPDHGSRSSVASRHARAQVPAVARIRSCRARGRSMWTPPALRGGSPSGSRISESTTSDPIYPIYDPLMFTGVKVFSATKAKDREELGVQITRWLRDHGQWKII